MCILYEWSETSAYLHCQHLADLHEPLFRRPPPALGSVRRLCPHSVRRLVTVALVHGQPPIYEFSVMMKYWGGIQSHNSSRRKFRWQRNIFRDDEFPLLKIRRNNGNLFVDSTNFHSSAQDRFVGFTPRFRC